MQAVAYDPERDVSELIKRHRKEIDELQKLTAQSGVGYDAAEHDDLFFLRYVLSNGSAAKSIDAVKFTIEYRKDPVNRYHLDKAAGSVDDLPLMNQMAQAELNIVYFHRHPALDGGPLQLIRNGAVDFEPLLDVWTDEELIRYTHLQKEWAWRQCDAVTRETGRLTKLIVANDFTGMRFQRPPKKWMAAFSESSKLAEKMYPQLVETTAMVHCPSWMKWIFSFVKLFLSKRTLSKFRTCPGGDDVSACPFVRSKIAVEHLPTYLGGTCECEDGCVRGLPNFPEGPLPKVPTAEEVQYIIGLVEKQRETDAEAVQRIRAAAK